MSAFKRNLVPLVCIAFVAASVATAIFYGLLGRRLREASADTPRQSIVVAARGLERGAIVLATDVKLSTWGGQYPLKGGFSAIAQVTGKALANAVQENEPVTQERLGAIDGSAGIGIAAGMRAISVHASDSSGVLALLHPGQKVDVQVLTGDRGGNVKLRTALENVEVLSVSPPDANGGRSAAPVVTLLATPVDADHLALADSGARIRLLLRNPLDDSRGARPSLNLASIFENWDAPSRFPATTHRISSQALSQASAALAAPVAAGHLAGIGLERVRLLVLIASAQPEALAQLSAQASGPHQADALQVVALPAGPAPAHMLSALEENHQIEVLSSTELSAGNGRQVGMEAGAAHGGCGLRIRFLPSVGAHGMLRLRVQPELVASRSAGIRARRIQTEVDLVDGQSFLIRGLSSAANWP
ncbi:MAG TPA: Flp pilus assembly protein CpaB, partial [Bryobacteraceae bacterium]|nr:Flp pilus assembly protein CpaB [Bryobacteraceae bacterium]